MRPEHLQYLVCPKTKKPLELKAVTMGEFGRVKEGVLREPGSGNEYPIVNYIPRFVGSENYAQNFGFQWNTFSRTQYDEQQAASNTSIRFQKETQWPADLRGEVVLEVGCGSGRFTPHILKSGALVISLDFSNAVDASFKSNGHNSNFLVVQASVYDMPVRSNFCDRAFCLGVIQHTPDPQQSLKCIVDCVKPGGQVATDVYAKTFTAFVLHPKYWIRPFVKNADNQKLLARVKRYVNFMWPIARIMRHVPVVGYAINSRLLLPDYSREFSSASDATLREMACLDTFDMLSPTYDLPQTLSTYRAWHQQLGLQDIVVHYGYNGIEGRATKPVNSAEQPLKRAA